MELRAFDRHRSLFTASFTKLVALALFDADRSRQQCSSATVLKYRPQGLGPLIHRIVNIVKSYELGSGH